jgi:hypothetical protein
MRTMMSVFALSLFIATVLAGGAARADEAAAKRDQANKDIADTKVAKLCPGLKKYLDAQKKACPDEAAEAAKVTCSAVSDYDKVQALNVKCSEKLKADAGKKIEQAKAGKATDPAAEALKSSCKATDESGAILAEASDKSYMGCKKKLDEVVKKKNCKEGVKKFKYTFQRADGKPMSSTVFCK